MCRRHLISQISKLDGAQACSVGALRSIQLQNGGDGKENYFQICNCVLFRNFCGMYKVVNWMMFAEWDDTHGAVLGLALGHETHIQLKSNSIVKLSNLG